MSERLTDEDLVRIDAHAAGFLAIDARDAFALIQEVKCLRAVLREIAAPPYLPLGFNTPASERIANYDQALMKRVRLARAALGEEPASLPADDPRQPPPVVPDLPRSVFCGPLTRESLEAALETFTRDHNRTADVLEVLDSSSVPFWTNAFPQLAPRCRPSLAPGTWALTVEGEE